MEHSVKIKHVLSQIMKLDYEARLYLAEHLMKQLKKPKKVVETPPHQLTELNALGSEIWKNVPIDKYIEQERQWD